jgi:uncharacterized membrane protein (UPF0127 family)
MNKTIQLKKIRIAKTPMQQFIGLMGQQKTNYALIFEFKKPTKTLASIHTMFMKFTIDILFLNQKKIIIEKTTLKPWTLNYTPKKPTKYIIETPTRTIKTKIGQKINWKKNQQTTKKNQKP